MRSRNHTTLTRDTNAKANGRIDEVENGLNGGKEADQKPGAWLPAFLNRAGSLFSFCMYTVSYFK